MPPGRPPKRSGSGDSPDNQIKCKLPRLDRSAPNDFSSVVKSKLQSYTRTGQACDRCKVRSQLDRARRWKTSKCPPLAGSWKLRTEWKGGLLGKFSIMSCYFISSCLISSRLAMSHTISSHLVAFHRSETRAYLTVFTVLDEYRIQPLQICTTNDLQMTYK